MGALKDVLVPDIGDFHDIPVIEILVKPGDRIAADDPVVSLESDKATMEVPAPLAGTVKTIKVALGDKVSQGSALLVIETADGEISAPLPVAAPVPPPEPIAPEQVLPPAVVTPPAALPPRSGKSAHATPSLRRYARELGVDLTRVSASGPKGRITKDDVQAFVKEALAKPPATPGVGAGLPPWPEIDFAKFGPIERVPLSRIAKISGPNLARNWAMIPHVTNFDEADITALEELRVALNTENAKSGPKVTMLAFLVKASVAALKAFPAFNASLDGDTLIQKKYYNIGFAADTPNGLVVPVIKDADKKGVLEIAGEMAALAGLAREGKLKASDFQGGCFSISSLGGIGGTGFTPIINAPEVAILGLTKAQMKPVWNGEAFVPRLMQPLCLSWDHRAVDGAMAGRFLAHLSSLIGDFRRVAL